jgi:hypothetical protein
VSPSCGGVACEFQWSQELCRRYRSYWQGLPSRTSQEWGSRLRETPWSSRLGVGCGADGPIPGKNYCCRNWSETKSDGTFVDDLWHETINEDWVLDCEEHLWICSVLQRVHLYSGCSQASPSGWSSLTHVSAAMICDRMMVVMETRKHSEKNRPQCHLVLHHSCPGTEPVRPQWEGTVRMQRPRTLQAFMKGNFVVSWFKCVGTHLLACDGYVLRCDKLISR